MTMRHRSLGASSPVIAAVLWALVFGGVHVAWAAGSRIALVDAAAADAAFHRLWFQVYNLGVAFGSFLAAGAVGILATGKLTGVRRRWVRLLIWAAGGLLCVRGLLGIVQVLRVVLDATSHEPLVAWAVDLYMLIGGVLFVLVAVQDRRIGPRTARNR